MGQQKGQQKGKEKGGEEGEEKGVDEEGQEEQQRVGVNLLRRISYLLKLLLLKFCIPIKIRIVSCIQYQRFLKGVDKLTHLGFISVWIF